MTYSCDGGDKPQSGGPWKEGDPRPDGEQKEEVKEPGPDGNEDAS